MAASSICFPEKPLPDMLEQMVDLQFTHIELAVHERGGHLKPSEVAADLEKAVEVCRATLRIAICALSVEIDAEGEEYYRQFAACCKLAKATKIVTIVISAGELGTPFNAEVERLRELVRIASLEGVVVSLRTEVGRVTQDPDTVKVLCNNVKGLAVTLDPSTFIFGPHRGNYDHILKNVNHVHLRDTTRDKLQVRIGQGEVEYGRLVTQLQRLNYNRALCVHIQPTEGAEHPAELRKLRLLLESSL